MLYSINNNDTLIQYDRDPIPLGISFIDYLEFEINDFTYILNKDDIACIFGGFIDNYINDYPSENKYKIFLEKMNDVSLDIEYLTLDELYSKLKDPSSIELDEWFYFSNNFFNEYFPNSTPQEIAELVYFSEIDSWNDRYVRFTNTGYLKTSNYINHFNQSNEILAQWIAENFKDY